MDGGSVFGRKSAAKKRLAAPRSLKVVSAGPAGVTLRWAAPKGAKPAYYVILRDGKSLGKTTRLSFTDTRVKPERAYRYAVRAYDKAKRAGALSPSVRAKVPKAGPAAPPTPGTSNPGAPVAEVTPTPVPLVPQPTPTPTPSPYDTMTVAMVDRLFWRAGFGPTQGQRDAWVGKKHSDLVDWLVSTPESLDPTMPLPKTTTGVTTLDPFGSEVELELEWLDRMQRAVNPLPQRMALYWHRHWVVSLSDGSVSDKWAFAYRNHLLEYADFGRFPDATFRRLAYEMTTKNAAMSSYLNLNANTRTRPNENYAREIMELFCLGPTDAAGNDNYKQEDIVGLTQAFTGWRLNGTEFLTDGVTPNPDYGKITFAPNQFEMAAKTILKRTIAAVTGSTNTTTNPASLQWGPSAVNQAVDIVLEHPQHAQFLIRKLWGEFIAGPIPQAKLDALSAEYRANGYKLKPLVRGILLSTEIFESLEEPNLIKPPIVYMVGVLRQLGAPMKHTQLQDPMNKMQQRIYRPPNVAGWEGGMSWLNTNTVQARFDMVRVAQYLRYSNFYRNTETPVPPASVNYPADVVGETPQAAYERAYDSVGRPWISAATRDKLLAYAATLSAANQTGTAATNVTARRTRFYALQAMILGGPDGQVM
ncbi:uncharacterized protein DUF1800 [Solirubrobacter pauli]|uniref:Uncharacterized protein DUF1800 n=1 Tax=Solirubrobacter pauli TaxID=166793 RepID=A0A660L003_9ACTN|nr:DUF1800 family protein [Solirubrobacter pauli]RKQ87267.1 uncharacterized protein DUF1800 [Solirubrobacter pauli]